jgi:hypothetical protein
VQASGGLERGNMTTRVMTSGIGHTRPEYGKQRSIVVDRAGAVKRQGPINSLTGLHRQAPGMANEHPPTSMRRLYYTAAQQTGLQRFPL